MKGFAEMFEDTSIPLDGGGKAPKMIYESVPAVEIVLKDMNLDVTGSGCGKKKKEHVRLLNDINCTFAPGELTALMGGSGAGKSTLLNAMAGRSDGVVSGSILVNGLKLSQDFKRMSWDGVRDAG